MTYSLPRIRRSATVVPKILLAAAVGIAFVTQADAASAFNKGLEGTPFESGADAAAIAALGQGATVRRSSFDNTLTADDRARFRAIGLPQTHAATIVLHKIKRTTGNQQLARLTLLSRSLDRLAPSEVCDSLVATGVSKATCTGYAEGPLGKVAIRMAVSATLTQSEGGAMHLVITNERSLEAKGIFCWSEIVAPGQLKVAYDLFPTEDGWLVQARVGVKMKSHEKSAKELSDALLKLESWLTSELSRS